jgi:hypothetical protein
MERTMSEEVDILPVPVNLAPSPKILNTLEMKRLAKSCYGTRRISIDDYNIADLRSIKDLLLNLHKSAKLNSEMHFESLEYFIGLNTKANILLLVMSIMGSIAGPILENHAPEIHSIFNSIALSIVGGWGLIINKLNYQTQVEQHRQAKESYDEIVDLIEMAIAYANESEAYHNYDFTHVLNEVQHIRQDLNKFTQPIPRYVLDKFIPSD